MIFRNSFVDNDLDGTSRHLSGDPRVVEIGSFRVLWIFRDSGIEKKTLGRKVHNSRVVTTTQKVIVIFKIRLFFNFVSILNNDKILF